MGDDVVELGWGVIGPGRIAEKVVGDIEHVEGARLVAVGSRSVDRARDFAERHGATRAHGSYGDLLADDEVDAVYIATPHRQHHAIAMAALAAGKHLLVEKSFTCTRAGAAEIAEAARASRRFVMEAMWTRFQPAIVAATRAIAKGEIGDVRSARADLGLRVPYDPEDRLWAPDQGGGALLDTGIYPLSFLDHVLGPLTLVDVAGRVEHGVDSDTTVLVRGAEDRTGSGHCSLTAPLPGTAAVFGTEGWIEVPPRFHHPDRFLVHPIDETGRAGEPRTVETPATGGGYSHEIAEVHRCVGAGLGESPVMPLEATVRLVGIMEEALGRLGITLDEDPDVAI